MWVIKVLKPDATSAFYLMWLFSYLLLTLLFLTQPIRQSSGLGDQWISKQKCCRRKLQNGANLFIFFIEEKPQVGLDLLTVEVSTSPSDTPQLGRTPLDEWPDRRRKLYLATHTLTRDRHPRPRRDSYLQSPQPSGHRHRRRKFISVLN